MKLNTPLKIALFISLIVSIITSIILITITYFWRIEINYLYILLAVIIIHLSSFSLIYFLLKKLITKKIKILYRIIHNYKINKEDFPINMDEDVLATTEEDVMDWVKLNRDEILKLKEQELFRKEFLGNLSHELKTPIFSIQGYILTLLEGGLEDKDINTKFLNRAAKGVDRMTRIIKDLDVITKFESDRIELNVLNNNIVTISNEVIDALEMKAKENDVTLRFNKKYSEAIIVKCDADKITQVLSNLINNAINYSKKNGYIELRFFDIEDNVLVEVSDDGIGIKKEHIPRLFERFYRIDKSRARNQGGTGLGLAIVKHIIEAHGQSINVRSTKNEGSTFSFTLKKGKKNFLINRDN